MVTRNCYIKYFNHVIWNRYWGYQGYYAFLYCLRLDSAVNYIHMHSVVYFFYI